MEFLGDVSDSFMAPTGRCVNPALPWGNAREFRLAVEGQKLPATIDGVFVKDHADTGTQSFWLAAKPIPEKQVHRRPEMTRPALSILPDARPARRATLATATLSLETFQELTVVQQIRRSFLPGARLAGVSGLLLGGLIPLSTWALIDYEVPHNSLAWVIVAGCLLWSAPTVYAWLRDAFGSSYKGFGAMVATEGILAFTHHVSWLRFAILGALIFINAVSSACALQVRREVD